MGLSCSLPEILTDSNFVKSSQPTISTIEQLSARDLKLKQNSSSNYPNFQNKFLIPFSEHTIKHQANHSVNKSGFNSDELSSKVITFKEYKQYLQSKRKTKIISTPVTSLIKENQGNNQRCRTATIRKLSKDETSQSSSLSSSPLALSTSSKESPSPIEETKLSVKNTKSQTKRVTWDKIGRKSSASDKESSDDSGISDIPIKVDQQSKPKSRVRTSRVSI